MYKQEVLRLLGFVSQVSKYQRDLPTQHSKLTWAKQYDTAFQEVKKLVVNRTILNCYDCNAEVTLQCDASEKGLGTALLQSGQPEAFTSTTLTPTEKRYAQIEKKCLAIMFACQRFRQYFSRQETILVESDHKPLQAIFKKSVLSAPCSLQGIFLRPQRFNVNVMYKPGSQITQRIIFQEHISPAKEKNTKSPKCLHWRLLNVLMPLKHLKRGKTNTKPCSCGHLKNVVFSVLNIVFAFFFQHPY